MEPLNEDIVLLKRYAETGDAQAFSSLVGRYQGFVYGICLRVLANASDAEDVTQECFLKLVRSASAVRSSVGGWLHRCAFTMSLNEKQKQAARRNREEESVRMNGSSNNGSPNGSDPTWQELAPHVDAALNELPDELRIVIVEHFFQRRTQAEISKELGVSAMTVSRRVESGIEELRKKLKKAGVIVSAALLASLVAEHAVAAAPAALTAALGKMAVAGVGKASAASTAAASTWVGKGTVAGAMTTIAKVKIAAVVAAAAVGVGALYLALREDGQPPAQPQPAAVADEPEEEPAAPKLDPLLAAIPADAVAFVWAPKLRQLMDSAGAFLPPVKMFLDDAVANKLPQLGVTDEVLDGPAAVVIVSRKRPGLDLFDPQMVGLFSVKDMDAVIATMEAGPDADGMYGRLVFRPATEEEPVIYRVNMMPYKGFAAFSDKKHSLQALADVGGKGYEPSAEAMRLIDGAQAFLHIDAATVRHMMDLAMREMRRKFGPTEAGLPSWTLPIREANAIDLALSLDDAGVKLRAVVALKDDSMIAEYLVPAPGLDKLEPRLPFLQQYAVAAWVKTDKKVAGLLVSNLKDVVERAMLKLAARAKWEALKVLTQGWGLIMRAQRDVGGPGFGIVLQMRDFGSGVGIFDLAEPQEFRARMQQQLDAVNKEIAQELGVPGELEYQPNAETVSSDDGLVTAKIDLLSHSSGISIPLAIIGDKLVAASSRGNISKALHTLQGRDDVPVLAEQPPAKALLEKIGLGHNAIIVLDLIPLFEEFVGPNLQLGDLAPAPVAIGLKAEEGNVLRIKAYLSKNTLMLMMGLSGPSARINRPPIEGNIERN